MGLETFGFIKDLVPTNPQGTDPKSEGDQHLRGLKQTMLSQFSGFTQGKAVTMTEDTLNGLPGRVTALETAPPDVAGRNFIVNPDFSVWQRGDSFPSGSNRYTADRWFSTPPTGVDKVPSTNVGTINSLRFGRPAGATATTSPGMYYAMESVESRVFAGRPVTLTVRVRAGADFSGGSSLRLHIISGTGNDQPPSGLPSSAWTGFKQIGVTTFAPTPTAQTFTVTGTFDSNITQVGLRIYYLPTGTAGADDTLTLEWVKLEIGSVATEFQSPIYADNLSRCLRYFQNANGTARGYATAAGQFVCTPIPVSVKLRRKPSISLGSYVEAQANISDESFTAQDDYLIRFSITAAAAGDFYSMLRQIILDAEL